MARTATFLFTAHPEVGGSPEPVLLGGTCSVIRNALTPRTLQIIPGEITPGINPQIIHNEVDTFYGVASMARQVVIPFPACLEEGGQGTLIRHSDNCTPGGEPSRDAKAAGL